MRGAGADRSEWNVRLLEEVHTQYSTLAAIRGPGSLRTI